MNVSHNINTVKLGSNMNHKYFLVFLTAIVVTSAKSYDGFKLYKVDIKTEDDLNVVKDIQSRNIVEFWEEGFDVSHKVRIIVAPEKQTKFLEILKTAGVEVVEVVEDLQRVIDDQMRPANIRTSESFLSLNWNQYHNLAEIYAWLDELAATYPSIVTTQSLGKSFENREIKGVIIKYKQNTTLIGMLEGTLHAREWISAATVTWIIKEFLTSTDPEVRALAENFEWHIFPIVNPDGYVYTFTTNRMWRKNRNVNNFKSCSQGVDDDMSNGIDLNRNFDFMWMTVGASNDSCSNTYAGPSAGSEPETKAIAQYTQSLSNKGQLMYYIAFHSYTQLIIIPYSHLERSTDDGRPDNYGDMYEIAQRGRLAILESSGSVYRVGVSAEVLYPMSGTSFDWVKKNTNVPICYLFELRDLGEFGFLLNREQIIPTAVEIVDSLTAMHKTAVEIGYYNVESSATTKAVSIVTVILSTMLYSLNNIIQ